MEKKPDFLYRDEGSIILLLPQNETAQDWTRESLQVDTWQDKRAIAIEPGTLSLYWRGSKPRGW